MTRYEHLIFDLDGTLIDSLPGIEWSARQALSACGEAPLACSLRPLLGPPIRTILAQATGIADRLRLDAMERAFRASYDSEGWRQSVCFGGTAEALDVLASRGMCLWLATNKYRLATHNILAELGLRDLFREVVCRDSRSPIYSSKGEMLASLVERHGLNRSRCLMIGDTLEDADAASTAGIGCAIVEHGYGALEARASGHRTLSGWTDLLNSCQTHTLLPSIERVLVNQR